MIKPILYFAGIFLFIALLAYGFGWLGEAGEVARDEFGPKAMLEKYEWFINQASAIEKMDQDIELFEKRVTGVDANYESYGEDKSKWAPHIQTTYNRERQQARDDLTAVVSQRNNLVRDYNAQSEKFNWAAFETELNKPRESFQEYASN